MTKIERVAAVIRSYAVARSTFGPALWYVYRVADVIGGQLPDKHYSVHTDATSAQRRCDELNASMVLEAISG